ncbi:MAG TPA: choice-of-anchor tandem repeat NxxGxxAF-containing protein [Candidatus Binatia bacterium]|nr:choice-of-anchor tandem repeat NxxGxxAF-containing protein [Candidatus Binatia bacterium]
MIRPSALSLLALLALPGHAGATSKATIAAIGDGAPGGGVFAGPGFSGWPSAGGNGWIAFRGEVTGGGVSETIVAAHMPAPRTNVPVASLGQPAPSGGAFGKCTGKLKQFVGHPVVNASGSVAFMALIEPPATTDDDSLLGPQPAGIFLFTGGELRPVACSGQATSGGLLDLVAVVDVFSDTDSDIADRSPALNDAGDVAFLTGYVNDRGFPAGGGIVVARAGGFIDVVRIDGPFDGGKFLSFGPPALNNRGVLAFHALATTTDRSDADGLVDGIFLADQTGVHLVVRDGLAPMPVDQVIFEFQDQVALNDRGDVAFLAGPLYDLENDGGLGEGSPGVLVWSAGVVTLLAYPGQEIGFDRVTGVALGPSAGSQLAGPSLGADGTLVFYVSLNGGGAEAIVRWDGAILLPLIYTSGTGADESPAGGLYAGTQSAPALDATGGFVFLARVAGGVTSQLIVYRAADGSLATISLGEGAPKQSDGFFGGKPFSSPHLNDRGDVVFRAFVARGPSSVGIFRARDGELQAVVRAGDPGPGGTATFIDVSGEPSLNQTGDVAFAAQLSSEGRGIFVADAGGIRTVALHGDPAPGEPGTVFSGVGTNPQIDDAGAVAFRGTTSYRNPIGGFSVKREGIFVRDAAGVRVLVYAQEPSPAGLPFLKLRDPLLTDGPSVVFRAPLGVSEEQTSGIFVAGATGTSALAIEDQALGNGVVLSGFSGNPSVAAGGRMAFLATRSRPIEEGGPPVRPLGPAVLRGGANGLELVVARDMRGPTGGTFRNLGQPAINTAGHVVFRGSFNPLTGGTSGFFMHDGAGLAPYLLRGEVAPVGGRFVAFGSQPSFNASDEIAFSAQIVGGKQRSGIFVASPARLAARLLGLRLSNGRGRDRVSVRANLELGRVADGVRPGREPVIVSLGDTDGLLWSATVPAKRLEGRRGSFGIVPPRASELAEQLRALRVKVGKHGVRVSALSAAVDLTRGGLRDLKPPFRLAVEVGDDAGTVVVACKPGRRGARCRS